ncbi:hypothetical protein GCM10011416_01450 [Polaribacter pacificus]|uniref:Lipoprotein n=1 Tax=Polaribacter pacificus TaxID=1775173 RepID=A0A917MAW8_9FLAO|nr:hypothetical protein [Polaribacter pacificus]GGG88811.1 hypothetical protein GCM10011416_01450 [Polaribacter pacificus]
MKKYIHKKAVIAAATILGVIGCTEFTEKIEDFNIGVTNAIFEQTAVLELKDAFGNQQGIVDTDFTVVFSGADADKLVSEAGEFEIKENDGFIQLSVNPNKSTGVKELNFDVTISGGSYKTSTFPVSLKDTVSKINLTMVDESKIYKGQNEASKTLGLTNNATTTATTVKTSTNGSLSTSAITIKTGTQFKDAAGAVLTGSDVKIAVTNTDALSDVLPSTSVFTFKDDKGVAITGKEATFLAGNTQITMDVNGTPVKKFNNAIDVAIEIPSDATNPTTGNPVQLGDTFPVYTNEDDSTDWTYHGLGTVIAGATAATFNISFETTHLSNYSVVSFKDTDCTVYTDNVTANNLAPNYNATFNIQLRVKTENDYSFLDIRNGEKFINIFEIVIKNGKVVSSHAPRMIKLIWDEYSEGTEEYNKYFNMFMNAGVDISRPFYKEHVKGIKKLLASGNDVYTDTYLTGGFMGSDKWTTTTEYQLYVKSQGVTYRTNLSNIATIANCEFNINLTQDGTDYFKIGTLKNIAIDVAASCGENIIKPDGFPLYIERENGIFSYEGTIKEGKMTLKGFELGKEYNFKTVYKGKAYYHKWTFDTENFKITDFEIPANLCSEVGF